MDKKGDIWVSAVLYFGLGVIVLTLILAAGLPFVNKLKDKNTAIETKNLLLVLDDNIRNVIRGGPGEQRVVNVEIKKGDFKILAAEDKIVWTIQTTAFLSEPGITTTEGNVNIITYSSEEKGLEEGEYETEMSLIYNIDLITSGGPQVLKGKYKLVIKNDGVDINTGKVKVKLEELV